ncbi:MAG: DUF928 domain-containing protein [Sphaerospermopsis sp. SIO1G1]|nr:DUF928 domain-containing protein [Sphaerospermopsis sp. SIO1G1]
MKLPKTPFSFVVAYLIFSILSPTVQAQTYSQDKTWLTSQGFRPSIDNKNNPNTIGAATRFKPPIDDRENPETVGAATRGSSCLNKQIITSLLPSSKLGLTVAKNPTFFWHIPTSEAKTAEFLLLTDNLEDENDQKVVYQKIITLPEQSGIVSVTLPEQEVNLETNNNYRWYLTLICDSEDSSRNVFVEGVVKPISRDLPVLDSGEATNLLSQASTYAQAGIWHDALTSLVKLRCQNPNDNIVKLHWQQFLESVALDKIESEPIINFCVQN